MQSNSTDNCVHHYNAEILNIFVTELHLINTKELLSELKKFKVQTILVLDYKK